jgi:multidrug efflux pump subunit AcrA (membrane-fusion protein)
VRGPLAIAGALVALVATTVAVARLREAPPAVERSAVVVGTVERGRLVRTVLGHGALVPEEVQWVVAIQPARVKRILVRAGATVRAEDVVVELDNPDLELAALDAERQLASTETELVSLGVTLETGRLAQGAVVEGLKGELAQAARRDVAGEALQGNGVLSRLDRDDARDRREALAGRLALEQKRLDVLGRGRAALLWAHRSQAERLRAIVAFRREQIAALHVRAGAEGVVQAMPVEPGQWVMPGSVIAKVAKPDRLKAEIHVAESQAKEIRIGQVVRVGRDGIARGRVRHVDPAVQSGVIRVDVAFDGAPPEGARPDLSVDGVIEIEQLDGVLYVGRPALAQPGRPVSLFKVDATGYEAERVRVELGSASVSAIEIKSGLIEGDRVLLSDTTAFDDNDRLRIR